MNLSMGVVDQMLNMWYLAFHGSQRCCQFICAFTLQYVPSRIPHPLLLHALWIPIIRNPPMSLDFQCKEPLALGIPNSHPWYRYGYFVLAWPYTFFFNFWWLWDFYPPECVSVFSGTTVIILIDIYLQKDCLKDKFIHCFSHCLRLMIIFVPIT